MHAGPVPAVASTVVWLVVQLVSCMFRCTVAALDRVDVPPVWSVARRCSSRTFACTSPRSSAQCASAVTAPVNTRVDSTRGGLEPEEWNVPATAVDIIQRVSRVSVSLLDVGSHPTFEARARRAGRPSCDAAEGSSRARSAALEIVTDERVPTAQLPRRFARVPRHLSSHDHGRTERASV